MRIRDWSSDVCSSDLRASGVDVHAGIGQAAHKPTDQQLRLQRAGQMILPLRRLHGELRQRLFVHCRGKAPLPLRPASPALDLERGVLLQASDLADQHTGGSVDVGVEGKPVVIRAGVGIDYYPVLAPDTYIGQTLLRE